MSALLHIPLLQAYSVSIIDSTFFHERFLLRLFVRLCVAEDNAIGAKVIYEIKRFEFGIATVISSLSSIAIFPPFFFTCREFALLYLSTPPVCCGFIFKIIWFSAWSTSIPFILFYNSLSAYKKPVVRRFWSWFPLIHYSFPLSLLTRFLVFPDIRE